MASSPLLHRAARRHRHAGGNLRGVDLDAARPAREAVCAARRGRLLRAAQAFLDGASRSVSCAPSTARCCSSTTTPSACSTPSRAGAHRSSRSGSTGATREAAAVPRRLDRDEAERRWLAAIDAGVRSAEPVRARARARPRARRRRVRRDRRAGLRSIQHGRLRGARGRQLRRIGGGTGAAAPTGESIPTGFRARRVKSGAARHRRSRPAACCRAVPTRWYPSSDRPRRRLRRGATRGGAGRRGLVRGHRRRAGETVLFAARASRRAKRACSPRSARTKVAVVRRPRGRDPLDRRRDRATRRADARGLVSTATAASSPTPSPNWVGSRGSSAPSATTRPPCAKRSSARSPVPTWC